MKTVPHLLACLALAAATSAQAVAIVGQPAPAFKAIDTSGKTVSLADFKGKTVVLEWMNPGCPFVQKHYGAGNMQATQKEALAKGAVWLSVNSTAVDAGDYMKPADLAAWVREHQAQPTATLMDADGKLGRAYGARTTPHMFVIDPQGRLAYAGAIDSQASARREDIASATNYVKAAVGAVTAGQAVGTAVTPSYGCSIKYSAGV